MTRQHDILFFCLILLFFCTFVLSDSREDDIRIDRVTPNTGSLNGGTKLIIHGRGFSTDYSRAGNTVKLVSSTTPRVYDCLVYKDGSSGNQIMCYTQRMVEGNYYIRVAIDGEDVPLQTHCNGNPYSGYCQFTASGSVTPTITQIEPKSQSGLPGLVLKLNGQIYSGNYDSIVPSGNGITEKIIRVYAAGQQCELKGENDEFYGLQLYYGTTGHMKCLMTGTYVGNSNASFIVSGGYGRSLLDSRLLRVASNDQIYLIQTYAEVTGVSPKVGSQHGDTEITISGNYFDETRSAVKVMVGGTECKVSAPITVGAIRCRTAEKLSAPSRYSGNRGLIYEQFKGTYYSFAALTDIWNLTKNTTGYNSSVIDEFSLYGEGFGQYSSRIHGYFVPPHSGEYTFRIDVSYSYAQNLAILYFSRDENPANKVEVASIYKNSDRLLLQQNKHYYIEALYSDYYGSSSLKVAAKHFQTKITGSMTGFAGQEKQRIKVSTSVEREVQIVTVTNSSGPATNEVQEIIIEETSGYYSDATYQIGLYGVYTRPLQTESDVEVIRTAISELPFFDISESVDVTATTLSSGAPGTVLTITFNSERGDFPDLNVLTMLGSNGENLTVSVSQKVAGVPSGKYFMLTMESKPSPLIASGASANTVKTALESLFTTRCTSFLTNPVGKNKFYTYEPDLPNDVWGTITNEIEPFCGQYVVRNPNYLYWSNSGGIQLTSTTTKFLCFAYQGNQIQNTITINYMYTIKSKEEVSSANVPVDLETTPGWKYFCLDMLSSLKKIQKNVSTFNIRGIQVYRHASADALYIDNVYIGQTALVTDFTGNINMYRLPPANPKQAKVQYVSVTSPSPDVYEITLVPNDCGSDFSMFDRIPGQIRSDGFISIVRQQAASPPISGTFSVTINNKIVKGISYAMDEKQLKSMIETIDGIGSVTVERTGGCYNTEITLTFDTFPGDLPKLKVDTTGLSGRNLEAEVYEVQDGGLWYDPIPGDMLRTDHDKAQVMVYVNEIPTVCSGDCTFEWSPANIPTITGVTPTSGAPGTTIIIGGTNLGNKASNIKVTIGGVSCVSSAANTNSVTCTIGQGSYGTFEIDVTVNGIGRAQHNGGPFTFQYLMNVTMISPTSGALGGGRDLTITGYGFTYEPAVTVGGKRCEIESSTPTKIICLLPANNEGAADVVVTSGGKSARSPTQYTYNSPINKPTITGVSPTSVGAAGGVTLTIDGTNFGNSGVLKIGSTVVPTDTFTNTQVTATLPSLPPATYSILLLKGTEGAAVDSMGHIPTIEYQLSITNVFPTKGSIYGGTRMTLTGQGFSTNISLTDVKVGSHECIVESASTTEIICLVQDTASVVKIDNQGIHPSFGKGYQWNPKVAQATVGDIIEWTWTTPSWILSFTHRVEQTANETTTVPAVDGFISSPVGTANGKFQYRVTTPGTYSYWSGYTDIYQIVYYRGTLVVTEKTSFAGNVSLKVAGQLAKHDINTGASDPVDMSACPGTTSVSGCSSAPADTQQINFQFHFDTCFSPVVTSLSQNQGTTSDKISISGRGFSKTACNNKVTFGDSVCTVSKSTDTLIECYIDPKNFPSIGLMQNVAVRINNLGNALIGISGQSARTFVLKPLITGISPHTSSVNGGASLTIIGTGYQGNKSHIDVRVNGYECVIQSVSYNEIVCISPPSGAGNKSIEVTVEVNGLDIPAVCAIQCELVYEPAETPEITDITPNTFDGSYTNANITGKKFSNQIHKIEVKIGGVTCVPISVEDSEIICTITNVPVGTQNVEVVITNIGRASNINNVQVTSVAVVTSVSPNQGSVHGGTELQITGNGFIEGSTTVTLGGSFCDLVEVTLSKVKCKTRSHVAGTVTVNIVSNGQQYGAYNYEYASSSTPTITSVSPMNGTQGTNITITGSNFGTSSGDNSVTTGSYSCNVTFNSANVIHCTAGAVPVGVTNIVVNVKNKGLSNNDKTFEFQLTVSGINKNTGSTSGGQTVTITGSGFDESTHVTICGQTCGKDVTASQTASQFVCVTPAASGSVVGIVACDIKITVNQVSRTLVGGFTYDQSLTPKITTINPSRGGTGGGTSLTISGSGFGTNAAQASVTIAGTACTISTITANKIVCTTGQHTPSQKTSVRVEINGNGIADQTNAEFFYIDVWSSPFTWGGESPPENGTLVVIPAGNIILLDQNTNRLKMLLIKGGALIFDENDLELFADNILIVEGGKLQIGSEDKPFQHKAIITGTAHLRTKELPIYGTNSIGVREGILDLHGQPIPIVWTRLALTAVAGSNKIVLQQEVNWKIGDQIVIASTGHRHSQRENEVHTIASIGSDKKTLTLVKNLSYNHLGVSETISGKTIEYRAEVGLLTRNIVLRGERDQQWTEDIKQCPDGFETDEFAVQTCFQGRFGEEMGSDQFGIHVIVHPAEPNNGLAISRVSYVEFTYAGQAFRLGRHPFYFHLGGNMSSSYIRGCAFHETFNRAINIHGTQNILIENNVIYNVMGGAVFLEDGVETGNTIQYNLAVFVRESTSLLNDDITPACFWVTNPDNTIQHNSAAGGSHFGFWYRLLPNAESVCPQNEKMGVFKNNTAHSFGWFGLWIFETYLPRFGGYCGSSTPTLAVFEGLFAWNCEKGAESVNTGSVQLHNFILVNNRLAGYEQKNSLEGEYYTQKGPLFKNGLIIGRSPALSSDEQGCTIAGIVLPYFYRFMVDGTNFANFNENGCVAFTLTSITLPDDGGFVTCTQNLKFTNVGKNNTGSFRWRYEGIIKDLDGSLTGIPNGTVIPTSNLLPPSCNHFDKFSQKFTASYCPAGVNFLRFSLNNISPYSYNYKNLVMENKYGNDVVNYQWNRLTHPYGWMVTLPVNETYFIEFKDAGHTTNMSFSGSLSLFYDNDYVIFSLQTVLKPDCVSVSNGICALMGNGGCVNESLTPVDGSVNYHGDWSYDNSTQRISFIVSKRCRERTASFVDTTVNFYFISYRCYYQDCIAPPQAPYPKTEPPPNTRPDEISSNPTTGTFPKEGDCVVIQQNQWIVLDRNLPPLAGLIIYGVLELDHGSGTPYRDFTINVTYILILGGRLIIGWEDRPFLGNVHIVLLGSWFTPECVPPVNIMESKIIGVYGGLDLHGKKVAIPWTTLNVTAQKGDTMLTVNAEVDWNVGDEIVVAPTGYKPWETETFRIVAISTLNNQSQINLNDTVKYRHIAYVDNTITLSAEVGLLTRNIKIEGADYPDLYKQSFGGRILVGANSFGTGYARISNVEFYHMGHEGFIETDDPRYAVAFVDSGPVTSLKPSYIRNSAFHHGFSPAIGVYNAPNMPIEDNVIHHSVWFSIQTNSDNTQIIRNMVVLMVWEGSYQDRSERQNIRYNGAISAIDSTSLVLTGNRVSGSERLAYHLPLQACDLPSSKWYSDNIARSSLIGTATFPDEVHQTSCNRISGLMVLKCSYYGIYYQNEQSVIFEDLILADNQIGIFPMVNGPSATSHEFDNKLVTVKNVQIIGTSSTFDCELDKNDPHDDNIVLSANAQPFDGSRRIGVTFGSFTSGSNNAPAKSFSGIETYQAIKGLTILKGVTFSQFSSQCSVSDYAIATNKDNDDGIHPIESSGLVFINVNKNNRIFIHRPNLGKINPADCVDMDCDGLKKAFLKDLDGSLMGTPGAVIPYSEFEWNGDPKRGLGDYRVPKSMQTDLNGNRIPMNTLAPIKGVIRNKGCVYVSSWQAYECHKFDYEMLVIESLDSDTETRRLSPVAILGHDEEGDGVIDLINGPQDHGRCAGYTCRKRLSTFQAIVATGRDYLIHFTSTTPQKLRFFLLNSDNSQAVLLAVWYSQPYRLDVYVNNAHVMPVNGRWKLGAYILDPPPVNQPSAFKPDVSKDAAGTNWFDRDSGLLYFIVRGSSEVTIKTAQQIIISFKYPAQTVSSLYGEKIVEYLAAFFDLPPEKVRVVKIVSAQQNSGRRRKRTTGNDEIVVEIGDSPSADFSGTSSNPLTLAKLQEVYAAAVKEGEVGNFSVVLNATVLGMSIAEPTIDPSDPKWGTITTSDGYRVLVRVHHLGFSPKLVPLHENAVFSTQPKIVAYDMFGNRVNELGTSVSPWNVTASIRSGTGSSSAQLLGNTSIKFVEGWANFTNLAISYPGTGYIIDFKITSPSEGENITLASDPFDVKGRPVTAAIVSSSGNVYEDSYTSVMLELRDALTGETIMDIAWRGHTWNIDAAIGKPELYNGTLEGIISANFSSRASFHSLNFTMLGMTVVKFHVTSTPAEYDFYVEHLVSVNGKHHIGMVVEETSDIVLRIDADYTKVVGTEDKYVSAMFGNWFANNYPQIRFDSITISPGSILVKLTVSGSKTDVNTTLFSMCSLISNDQTFIYNGINLTLSNYMYYKGNSFYGVSCNVSPKESAEIPTMYIIIGACISVCVLCVVILLVKWKCSIYPKTKIGLPYDEYGTKYGGKNDDEILFREVSFMSLSAPRSTSMEKSFPQIN